MTKYNYKFKKQVVEAYLNGVGGYSFLAQQFGIPNPSTVRKWVRFVDKLGFDALKIRKDKQHYSSKFKQDALHYYLTSGDSYLNVAIKFGLPSDALLLQWHQAFHRFGIQGLSPKSKGRPSMSKKTTNQKPKNKLTREQELERENELLRAELAFVKKLRALGMTIPDRLKNETHESSTNSEKNSD